MITDDTFSKVILITDDTFSKVILIATETAHLIQPTYFQFADHGGPVDDPLRAASATNLDDYLGFMLREAARTHGNYTWEPRRLIVRVEPFSSLEMVDKLVRHSIRQKALKKLEPHEREVLGL